MNIKEIRRMNLRTLMDAFIDQEKSKAKFAEAIGVPASQLSQLTSSNATRNIGDKIARRVEMNLNLPYGWLDTPYYSEISEENKLTLSTITFKKRTIFNVPQLDTAHDYDNKIVTTGPLDVIKSIGLDPQYASEMFGRRPANSLRITTAMGDSMLDTISPGELLFLDITVTKFIGDGIYAFNFNDSKYLKRIQKTKYGLDIISDNKNYEKWNICKDDVDALLISGLVIGKMNIQYTRYT